MTVKWARPNLCVMSTLNLKGGITKTTETGWLAHFLAENNQPVILIDLDPKTHLSEQMGVAVDASGESETIYTLCEKSLMLSEDLEDLLVSPTSLKRFQPETARAKWATNLLFFSPDPRVKDLPDKFGAAALKNLLDILSARIDKHKFVVLIDCNNSPELVQLGLAVSDIALIPYTPEPQSDTDTKMVLNLAILNNKPFMLFPNRAKRSKLTDTERIGTIRSYIQLHNNNRVPCIVLPSATEAERTQDDNWIYQPLSRAVIPALWHAAKFMGLGKYPWPANLPERLQHSYDLIPDLSMEETNAR